MRIYEEKAPAVVLPVERKRGGRGLLITAHLKINLNINIVINVFIMTVLVNIMVIVFVNNVLLMRMIIVTSTVSSRQDVKR